MNRFNEVFIELALMLAHIFWSVLHFGTRPLFRHKELTIRGTKKAVILTNKPEKTASNIRFSSPNPLHRAKMTDPIYKFCMESDF